MIGEVGKSVNRDFYHNPFCDRTSKQKTNIEMKDLNGIINTLTKLTPTQQPYFQMHMEHLLYTRP
jgi:hypothetical protein